MIKVHEKPIQELKDFLKDYNRILNIGCGGCASVCLAGGQREVRLLNDKLKLSFEDDSIALRLDGYTVERACNDQYIQELDSMVADYDCIISMACAAGVQFIAERFPVKPVFPAVNTMAIGVDLDVGIYQERCRACGSCVIGYTGGICPVTRCAKGLFNGPCGGTNEGKCEISNEVPCAWYEIYNRLKEQGRLNDIMKIKDPMQWENQTLRTVIQERYVRA